MQTLNLDMGSLVSVFCERIDKSEKKKAKNSRVLEICHRISYVHEDFQVC